MKRIVNVFVASVLSILLCTVFAACGQDSSEGTSDAPGGAPAAPAAQAPAKTVQQISAEAQRCLDLVKTKQYAEAIAPCEQALQDTANADVEKAYAEAKAEVKKVGQDAAAQAATDALAGKPADEAAKDAAADALGNLGK